MTTLWVDADACPGAIRDIVLKAAQRRHVNTVFVAHQPLRVPRTRFVRAVVVAAGFDAADDHIATEVATGDLVVTADIPLAARVVAAGATAINPRGTEYTAESVHSHLAKRNLLTELREQGVVRGGPAPLGPREIQAFANSLDRHLTRLASAN